MATAKQTSMDRWVAVLDQFTTAGDWGVRDLAARIGVPPSATHRILHDMVRTGLLAPGQIRGRFRIGSELARLSILIGERIDVRRSARPILEEAVDAIGETVILTSYSPRRRAFWAVDAVESRQTIRYIWEPLRAWNDLLRGASGKGILAFLPDDERDTVIAALPPDQRPAISASLETIRGQGFAISHGERFEGAVGVSAPIRDATGRVIGGLVAGWPDNRTSPEKEARSARVLVEAAARISRDLGWEG
jgi:DNA-binding IclR family transcriptional regulator